MLQSEYHWSVISDCISFSMSVSLWESWQVANLLWAQCGYRCSLGEIYVPTISGDLQEPLMRESHTCCSIIIITTVIIIISFILIWLYKALHSSLIHAIYIYIYIYIIYIYIYKMTPSILWEILWSKCWRTYYMSKHTWFIQSLVCTFKFHWIPHWVLSDI